MDDLTLIEAARLAGVNPASLRHAIRDERLSAVKRGRDWFVASEEIARYIRERRTWQAGGRHMTSTDTRTT